VLVLAPAPVVVAQAASSADATAVVATTQPKSDAPVNLQADADKSADEQKALAKTALQAQTDAKPQATAGDSDKNSVAQFRGETPVNSHRGAGAETHAPVTPDANLAAPKTGADMMPPTILNTPSHNTAPAINNLTLAPQLPPQAAPIPLAGLAFEITNKALAGKNHFEIRLDPPELGRIEVRLDVDRDGNVTSRMIADRSDTLDLLRRDASGLERALQDAGLKTANNSLQFSLRDQSMGQQQTGDGADAARLAAQDEALLAIEPKQIDYGRLAGRAGGLDIRV
jgi:flagellar hook-length control protein FliK